MYAGSEDIDICKSKNRKVTAEYDTIENFNFTDIMWHAGVFKQKKW